jgi:anti-sigma factor RsiW
VNPKLMKVMQPVLMGPVFATCAETGAHLSDYLDGELRGLRRWRVARHLDFCPHCQAVLRSLRRTVERLRELGATEPNASTDSVADEVIERIRRESGP